MDDRRLLHESNLIARQPCRAPYHVTQATMSEVTRVLQEPVEKNVARTKVDFLFSGGSKNYVIT